MSARDDFGSNAGRPGGYNGGAGGLGNGGVGGGMGGGFAGGGAGINGGINSRTGMTTGTQWNGTSAFGRPGGPAMGWGMSPAQARANAFQGLLSRLVGPQRPAPGAPPVPGVVTPQVQPSVPPMIEPGIPPFMPTYPEPPLGLNTEQVMVTNFPPQSKLKPGQPKYQDRVPSGVGPGVWRGQAGGPHWSSNGTYSGYDGPRSGGVGSGRGSGGGGGSW